MATAESHLNATLAEPLKPAKSSLNISFFKFGSSFSGKSQSHAKQQSPTQQAQTATVPTQPATRSRHVNNSAAQFSQLIELYKGRVATVYLATDDLNKQRVILKCYHKSEMEAKHYHKLDREIQAMQLMRGPYVAELYCWFQDDESVWLVMEFCEGGDLFKCLMVHSGRLDEAYVCTEIIAPLLRVLEKSHAQNIMHRDIKPENIFLTKAHRMRLGDFGLAVDWTQELPFSRSGTLDYMAPEVLRNPATRMQEGRHVPLSALQQRGIRPYNEKVDVWAVGVLAYELISGKPPFEVEDETETAKAIMYSNTIRFPSSRSPLWADFVRCALIKDPAKRPSAAELMEHAWITHHIQSALMKAAAQGRESSKQLLLKPLPLPPATTSERPPVLTAPATMPQVTAAAPRPPRGLPPASGAAGSIPKPPTHQAASTVAKQQQTMASLIERTIDSPAVSMFDKARSCQPAFTSSSGNSVSSFKTATSTAPASPRDEVLPELQPPSTPQQAQTSLPVAPRSPRLVIPATRASLGKKNSSNLPSPGPATTTDEEPLSPASDRSSIAQMSRYDLMPAGRSHSCMEILRIKSASTNMAGAPQGTLSAKETDVPAAALYAARQVLAAGELSPTSSHANMSPVGKLTHGISLDDGRDSIPSPAPAAGHKQRSLLHLKNQAWL